MTTGLIIIVFIILGVLAASLKVMRKERHIPPLTRTCKSCGKPQSAAKHRPDCYDCWLRKTTPPPPNHFYDPDRLEHVIEALTESSNRMTNALSEVTETVQELKSLLTKQNQTQDQDSS